MVTRSPVPCHISSRVRTLSITQRVLCEGVVVFGVPPTSLGLTAHAISRRGCSHGHRGASLKFMMLPTNLGEAAHHPMNPAACVFTTCASARHLTNVPRWWRYHAAFARRTKRHPRVAPFLLTYVCDTLLSSHKTRARHVYAAHSRQRASAEA